MYYILSRYLPEKNKITCHQLLRAEKSSYIFIAVSVWKVTAIPSQRGLNRISRLTHWRVLHRASSCSCSGPVEPGIWGHAYEVNGGGPDFVRGVLFRDSGPARDAACENAQSSDLRWRSDPVGASRWRWVDPGRPEAPREPQQNCQNKTNAGTLARLAFSVNRSFESKFAR